MSVTLAFRPRPLRYDLVIATRNRPDALALSLPLMIGQSRPPERLIVVDSSDDPTASDRAVAEATAGWDGTVIVHHSTPGLPRQRNIGLAEVTAPIVFFFDDDSLPHPGAAASILEVYERDTGGAISGVAAMESMTIPEGVPSDMGWKMTVAHAREARNRGWRNRIERHATALKPSLFLGKTLNARHAVPDWLAEMDVVPVEYMTGFRMTFRTDAIRRTGFDEALGGYALDEDVDASFSAMASGAVVAARRARVYHHRAPGGRGASFEAGRMTVFNRAYVLLKHAGGAQGSPRLVRAVWRRHRLFMAMKVLSQLPGLRRADTRVRLAGILDGVRGAFALRRDLAQVPVGGLLATRMRNKDMPTA